MPSTQDPSQDKANASDANNTARLRKPIWPWAAAALSGLLLALCFPPYNVSGLAFVALIPLLCAVWLHRPARWAGWYWLRLGYVTGLVFFSMTFAWLHNLASLFLNGALNFLSVYLAFYSSLYIAVWAFFAGWIVGRHFEVAAILDPLEPKKEQPPLVFSTRNLGISLLLASAWAGLEWLRGLGPLSFGWNGLGVAVHKELALIQIAEFTGTAGISFLLVMINAIILITLLRFRTEIGRGKLRPHFDFTVTVALLVATFAYGVRVITKKSALETTPLKVATIQPNVPQKWKMPPPGTDEEVQRANIEDIYRRLEENHGLIAAQQPHLTLWPEACVPSGMLGSEDNFNFVRELAGQVPALMLGTDDFNRDRNSAAFFVRGQKDFQLYDKRRLVPFGEYLPYRNILGGVLGDLLPGDFAPGESVGVFELPNPKLKLAPLICFEDTVDSITREPVQQGAQVLINLTNDGWFGETAGADTHLANSVLRAVENRRPLIRCTNTGTTSYVDAFGRIDRWIQPFTENRVMRTINVAVNPPTTFFTQNGNVFAAWALIVSAVAAVGRAVAGRRRTAM